MSEHHFVCFTETHESPERGLPIVTGFQWESTYKTTTRQSAARGSGGVAILFRHDLHRRIQVMSRDEEACYMWVRLDLTHERGLYVAICYFSPHGSRYAIHDPYSRLSEDISHYKSLGEVLFMGDFNGRTQSRQCEIYDMEQPEIMTTLDAEDMGVSKVSADEGQDNTGYDRHLLELGSRHHLVIYNGMARWPDS
ncbi:hypothetical protein L7F22_040235 [Adiantum nelumboides]|nr:hypothetical protein [Adiantum nelumboides]